MPPENRVHLKLFHSSSPRLSRQNRAQPPKLSPSVVELCRELPSHPDDDSSTARSSTSVGRSTTTANSSSGCKTAKMMARPAVAPLFTDSPNARSKTITTASGPCTNGILNQLPSTPCGYSIGVSEDTGSRRTMEDSHSFVADFAGVRGQGYFAVFDGHAGKHAAEWCGEHFHEELIEALHASLEDSENGSSQKKPIVPDVLNATFHAVDDTLSRMADEGQTHSGCTAVTAFLRLEDDDGNQPRHFIDAARTYQQAAPPNPIGASSSSSITTNNNNSDEKVGCTPSSTSRRSRFNAKVKNAVRNITGKSPTFEPEDLAPHDPPSSLPVPDLPTPVPSAHPTVGSRSSIAIPPSVAPFPHATRRVLYTANAGDARAVLSRGGKAVRLTYDHKGSDAQEARRIKEAGGFVMNNRVNGVLAVTRSLGDSSMKEFVVGAPYTTETVLGEADDILILACDGLWDVIDDQAAIDLVRPIINDDSGPRSGAQEAAEKLVKYALDHFSGDNISVIVIRLEAGWKGGQ